MTESAAYIQPEDLCNKQLAKLSQSGFSGSVKNMTVGQFVDVAYNLAEMWDVGCCDSEATTLKAKYNCAKCGARSMGSSSFFPSVKEAKKMKDKKNRKKIVRFFLHALEKLEDKYSDLYSRRSWPKASAKEKLVKSAPPPTVVVDLPECAFGPDAVPGDKKEKGIDSPLTSGTSTNPPAAQVEPQIAEPQVVDISSEPEDVTIVAAQENRPSSTTSAQSVSDSENIAPNTATTLKWRSVDAGVMSFPRVIHKIKQLIVKKVFKEIKVEAEMMERPFQFKVTGEIDLAHINHRLSLLMKRVLHEMPEQLDAGLQESLKCTAEESRFVIC